VKRRGTILDAPPKKKLGSMNPASPVEHLSGHIRPAPQLDFVSRSVQLHRLCVSENYLAGQLAHKKSFVFHLEISLPLS
jgi:hypothetical protein